MRTFDLTPLYRATVGFDRIDRLFDSLARQDESNFAYPPYNIEKLGENDYRITMAVAGFGEGDLDITVKEGSLYVTGKGPETNGTQYLHHGIARRAFERRFELADHVVVKAAALKDGLLAIDLARELPEAMKPRRVAIATTGPAAKMLESTVAPPKAA